MAQDREFTDMINFMSNPSMLRSPENQQLLNQMNHQPTLHQNFPANIYHQSHIPHRSTDNSMGFPPTLNTLIQFSQQLNQFSHQQHQVTMLTPPKTPLKHAEKCDVDSNADFMAFSDNLNGSPQLQTPSKVDQNMKSLYEMQRIALQGCESAAKISQHHSKRPFFKKIDLLCDRLKLDLGVTNKAVLNINSHGVAWAIKDYIFVFNRIISAWVIMRDYFYSISDGMQCVKKSIDPNLTQIFLEWQDVTREMAKSLINSFEKLHKLDQHNGNRKVMSGVDYLNKSPAFNFSKVDNDYFQNLFVPLIDENSEQAQVVGGYMKSGRYQPLTTSKSSSPPIKPESQNDFDSFKLLCNDVIPENEFLESGHRAPLYKRSSSKSAQALQNVSKNQHQVNTNLTDKFNKIDIVDGIHPISGNDSNKITPISFEFLQELYGNKGGKIVICLLNDVMTMPESVSFLSPSQKQNFPNHPNFIQNEDDPSMTRIIENIQGRKYKSLHDVFIAFKLIAEYAKAVLRFHPHDDKQMQEIICGFVRGIEASLSCHV